MSFPWKPVRSGNQPADIAEWCCTAASSFPFKPDAKPGCRSCRSRTRMDMTGTGAPQCERRNTLFNLLRPKATGHCSGRPALYLSYGAGLICERRVPPVSDSPSSTGGPVRCRPFAQEKRTTMEIKCLTQDFPQGKRVYDADGVAPSLMHTASTMRSQAILVRGGGQRRER